MDGLPVESLTVTRIRDQLTPEQRAELDARPHEGHGPWSRTDMLLALIADRVERQTWLTTEWKTRPPAPDPVPRPGVERERLHGRAAIRARVSDRTWQVAEALRQGMPIPPSN